MLLICIVLLVAGGWYLWRQMPAMLADAAQTVGRDVIEDMQLAPEQKQRLTARLDQLIEDFKAGQITTDELVMIGQRMAEDKTLIAATILYMVENHVLTSVELPEEKRNAAIRAAQRTARGVAEGTIELKQLERAADPLLVENPEGGQELKENLTEADIDAFTAACRDLADQAEVPDEPYEVDIVEALERVIDDVLEEQR